MLPAFIGLDCRSCGFGGGISNDGPDGTVVRTNVYGRARESKQIFLTYDDGPNDAHTLKLLEVLAKHSVQATFFMIGATCVSAPTLPAR